MRFEKALSLLREGKKITNPYFEKDVYFMACRLGIISSQSPEDSWPITIVKMKGDYKHPDMVPVKNDDIFYPGDSIVKDNLFKKKCNYCSAPQFPLCLVMCDKWIVIE